MFVAAEETDNMMKDHLRLLGDPGSPAPSPLWPPMPSPPFPPLPPAEPPPQRG